MSLLENYDLWGGLNSTSQRNDKIEGLQNLITDNVRQLNSKIQTFKMSEKCNIERIPKS